MPQPEVVKAFDEYLKAKNIVTPTEYDVGLFLKVQPPAAPELPTGKPPPRLIEGKEAQDILNSFIGTHITATQIPDGTQLGLTLMNVRSIMKFNDDTREYEQKYVAQFENVNNELRLTETSCETLSRWLGKESHKWAPAKVILESASSKIGDRYLHWVNVTSATQIKAAVTLGNGFQHDSWFWDHLFKHREQIRKSPDGKSQFNVTEENRSSFEAMEYEENVLFDQNDDQYQADAITSVADAMGLKECQPEEFQKLFPYFSAYLQSQLMTIH